MSDAVSEMRWRELMEGTVDVEAMCAFALGVGLCRDASILREKLEKLSGCNPWREQLLRDRINELEKDTPE